MKSQARLRLRQAGKHRGDPRWWIRKFEMYTLSRAFEMNVWPRHYADDDPPPAYRQMTNYLTGEHDWHQPGFMELTVAS